MKKQMLLTAVISALAASAITGGISWAANPGDGGVIQGCYDSGGNLKVVAALPCPKGYTALSWNQQGSPGLKGDKGDPGAQGLPGNDGAPGVDGMNGENGVSVTSAPEPSGQNCANGGSKFTAANGISYACNGVDGSVAAVIGQDARTLKSTATLTLPATAGDTVIPGLSTSITATSSSLVYVSTDGSAFTASTATDGFSALAVGIEVDGSFTACEHVLELANTAGHTHMSGTWSMSAVLQLTPGPHTIDVVVRAQGGVDQMLVAGALPPARAVLNVITIKK